MADHSKPAGKTAENKGHDSAKIDGSKVQWDDSQMASTYANVVNATASREEVTVFFGTNRTWNINDANTLVVNLTNRIILNPHAAKRLLIMLMAVLADYEKKHGKINIGQLDQVQSTTAQKE
jgi:hypothetical protein